MNTQSIQFLPIFIQNILISAYNTYLYRQRHGGKYQYWRKYYEDADHLSRETLQKRARKRLSEFLNHAVSHSPWYSQVNSNSIDDFPYLTKHDLIQNFDNIKTIHSKDGLISYTGGTTGASMRVVYTKDNMQERFALLDHFRAKSGYTLGKRTAWFSGKSLITKSDIQKGICYRDDYFNNIRFFSTFHITESNFEAYWHALCQQNPEFIVGFPSSVFELCRMAKARNFTYPHKVKTFFPTAESLLDIHRHTIQSTLGCSIRNQYASSEGAPFILECDYGELHIHPLSGLFEDYKTSDGTSEVAVTSFTTMGTPLIRYRIGDSIQGIDMDFRCQCGTCFPRVERIEGRSTDYIFSPTNGRVNLGNLSNCTKDIPNIVCFQIIQNENDHIHIKLVVTSDFQERSFKNFLTAIMQRVGEEMHITTEFVDQIERANSGKFKFVINNLNH